MRMCIEALQHNAAGPFLIDRNVLRGPVQVENSADRIPVYGNNRPQNRFIGPDRKNKKLRG